MAIGLSDAILSFAGGAATQFNKIADEERKAAAKRKERLQEMVDNATVKQEETKYSYAMAEHQEDLALASTLKSIRGGARSGMGQLAIAQRRKLNEGAFLKSSDFGSLVFDGPSKAPIPYSEQLMRYASGDFDPQKIKYAERYREKNEGKTFTKDGAGILRGVTTDANGRAAPLDVAEGLGIKADGPAWLAGDPPTDPEEYKQYAQDFAKAVRGEKIDSQWIVDKETGAISLGQVDESGKGTLTSVKPGREDGFAGTSPEGKQIGDLRKLQVLAEKNPEYTPLLKQYEELIAAGDKDLKILQGTTTLSDGSSRDVAKLVEVTKDGMNEVGTPVLLGTGQDDPNGPDSRGQKDLALIIGRTASAREMQDAIIFRMRNFTSGQQEAAAAITSTADFLGRNIQGLMELGGVKRETMVDQLNAIRGETNDFAALEEMRQSNSYLTNLSKTNLEWLSYSMANVLKEVGDERTVTGRDVEAGAKLVSRLFSTEGGLAASSELMHRLDVRSAQSNQMVYQDLRATPAQKSRHGRLLVRSIAPDVPNEWIIESPQTGQVYIFSSEEHLNNFKSRVQEMGLLNKPVDKVLAAFPESLRPSTLESHIEDADGWLMPDFDPARYEAKILGK